MNRGEIVGMVSERTDLPAAQVDFVLTHILQAITDGLDAGETVSIRRFGKFEPRHRNAVVRRNPRTGEEIPVPAKRSVGFVPSGNLKDELNRKGRGRGRQANR